MHAVGLLTLSVSWFAALWPPQNTLKHTPSVCCVLLYAAGLSTCPPCLFICLQRSGHLIKPCKTHPLFVVCCCKLLACQLVNPVCFLVCSALASSLQQQLDQLEAEEAAWLHLKRTYTHAPATHTTDDNAAAALPPSAHASAQQLHVEQGEGV